MKLVDLLVERLEEWPESVTYFVQDVDGEVKAGGGDLSLENLENRHPLVYGLDVAL